MIQLHKSLRHKDCKFDTRLEETLSEIQIPKQEQKKRGRDVTHGLLIPGFNLQCPKVAI